MKELTLIDANSLIHRAYHALPPLTDTAGNPAQALYGVSLVLMKLQEEGSLEYAAALFDRPEPTFRKKQYAEYKATRPAAADALIAQIISAHDLFGVFGIKVFEKAGFEADDCIATLAERFRKIPDTRVTILTGDMDTLQLVEDPVVRVRAFRKGVTDTVIYDEAGVMRRLGVPPSAATSFKALVGDSSDNIKGVVGIGPKTAAELVMRYGTLEGIYEHLGEIPRYADRFRAQEEAAMLARELVVLVRDVPLDVGELEALCVKADKEGLRAYFSKLGFKRLVARIDDGSNEPSAKTSKKKTEKKTQPNPAQKAMF